MLPKSGFKKGHFQSLNILHHRSFRGRKVAVRSHKSDVRKQRSGPKSSDILFSSLLKTLFSHWLWSSYIGKQKMSAKSRKNRFCCCQLFPSISAQMPQETEDICCRTSPLQGVTSTELVNPELPSVASEGASEGGVLTARQPLTFFRL